MALADLKQERIDRIINHKHLSMTVKKAQQMIVTKIEMMQEGGEYQVGGHWVAKITTRIGAEETQLVADMRFRLPPASGETYTTFSQAFHGEDYPDLDAFVNFTIMAGTRTKPLTLAQLMECVTDRDIHHSGIMCFIYVYRMLQFATGQCNCDKCLTGASTEIIMAKMKSAVAAEKKIFIVSEHFKRDMKNWKPASDWDDESYAKAIAK